MIENSLKIPVGANEQDVTLGTPSGAKTSGKVYIKVWTSKERQIRALKILFKIWGVAVLCVFIPVVHFFLVPFLLIAGPVVSHYTHKQKSVVLGGKAICPYCSKDFEIVKAKDKWPITDICGSCHQHVEISKSASDI